MLDRAKQKREQYYKRKAEGKCPKCGQKLAPKETHVYCSKCRSYMKTMQFVYDSRPEHRENKRKINKELYHWRKQQGMCVTCGKEEPAKGSFSCEKCLLMQKLKALEKQKRVA